MESKKKHLERYYERKILAVIYLGGECKKCKSILDLQFDHIKAKDKKCNITKMLMYSWKKLTNELDKCQLLCPKCHLEKSKIDAHRNPAKGSRIGSSKLTDAKVIEIKSMIEDYTQLEIAKCFGVSRETIGAIKNNRIWKHIKV